MNFGGVGTLGMIFGLVIWGIPLILLVWFVRTLTAMSVSLRDIADRLIAVERAIREMSIGRGN